MNDSSRLASLQDNLKARLSVFHFAHAAVSLLVGMVAACTAGRIFWDSELAELPLFGAAVVVSLVMLGHGVIRWALGRRAMRVEDAQFAELRALRRALGLDDPTTLLPR